MNDHGLLDDCLGTPKIVTVTVEPNPMLTASAASETICHNTVPTITADVTALNGNNYRVTAVNSAGTVGGFTAGPTIKADGAGIESGTLTNTTSLTGTVTYTLTPYTYGTGGVDEGGLGNDCTGTPTVVVVVVEPTQQPHRARIHKPFAATPFHQRRWT